MQDVFNDILACYAGPTPRDATRCSPRGLTRQEAVEIKTHKNIIPIGLINHAPIKRPIEPGQIMSFDDVDIPESLALKAWLESLEAPGKNCDYQIE